MNTILIIDDDVTQRQTVIDRFTGPAYRILAATGGADGLDKARQYKPDVIILDLRMPKMDGHHVLLKIRTDPLIKDTPVVIFSVAGDEPNHDEDEEEAYANGALAFLRKNIDQNIPRKQGLNVLHNAVANILAHRDTVQRQSVTGNGACRADKARQVARIDNTEIVLTNLEFKLWEKLVEHKNSPVRRADLIDELFPPERYPVDTDPGNRLEALMRRLRAKIAPYEQRVTIQTRLGVGYQLTEQSAGTDD